MPQHFLYEMILSAKHVWVIAACFIQQFIKHVKIHFKLSECLEQWNTFYSTGHLPLPMQSWKYDQIWLLGTNRDFNLVCHTYTSKIIADSDIMASRHRIYQIIIYAVKQL